MYRIKLLRVKMYKRQKAILIKFIVVILITVITVVAMINFKDWINRSEAILAMEHLGKAITGYRDKHGSAPAQSFIDQIENKLPGFIRLGDLKYRARWLDFESDDDVILAYTEKKYNSLFLKGGYVVLRLGGETEWMDKEPFETLLESQQTTMEKQMQKQ